MHTFFGTLGAGQRRRWRRHSNAAEHRRSPQHLAVAEDGFLLIEVLVSLLLVAIIVTATFNGFDVVNRLSADERHHNVAAVLAAQSQEQLRSDSATTLDALESKPHSYVREIPTGGTRYTITQEAHPINASGESTGCSATETSSQSGANIQIVSTVTWPQLSKSKRPAVKQASIITPPVGSALEVDVTNGQLPPAGVSGVTAIARFTPVESGAPTTAEGTTGTAGCVVLTGLAATAATVEIIEKSGFVTPNGELKPEPKEVTITPNLTTHYEVTYYEAGKIQAEYTYKGLTTFEGQTVMGDTFTVFNSGIPNAPEYEVGSIDKGIEYAVGGEEPYKAITTGKYATTASTPAGTKYAKGDLFPFPTPWSVNAGDCHKNGAVSAEALAEGTVLPGKTTTVKVPLSMIALNVYTGIQTKKEALSSTAYEATLTNTECEGEPNPNNSTGKDIVHIQNTSTTGHLSFPFQPFGTGKLCVYNKAAKKTYEVAYSNTTVAGSTRNIYIGEPSPTERTEKREAAETAETTAKNKRLAEEKTARETWKKEEEKKLITKAQREAKEATQTTERKAAETTEANAKTAREAKEKEETPEKPEDTIKSGQASC
jgi:Tfp pilus assembly protein PilV